MAGGGVASEFDPLHTTQYSLAELEAIVGVAEDYGTYVLVHAYHDRSVNRAIDAGDSGLWTFSPLCAPHTGAPKKLIMLAPSIFSSSRTHVRKPPELTS